MIFSTKLVRKDLESFSGKKIILCGPFFRCLKTYKILKALEIESVDIYIVSNAKIVEIFDFSLFLLSENQLEVLLKQERIVIVLEKNFNLAQIQVAKEKISNIVFDDLIYSFSALLILKKIENPAFFHVKKFFWNTERKRTVNLEVLALLFRKVEDPIFICLPMKTADHSFYNTFDSLNTNGRHYIEFKRFQRGFSSRLKKIYYYVTEALKKEKKAIEYANVVHKPRCLAKCDFKQFKTVKIITGVREPVSQNLSALYQELPSLASFNDWILGDLENDTWEVKKKKFDEYEELILEKGNDIQFWFDEYIERYVYPSSGISKKGSHARSIQQFYGEFCENIVDLTNFPFDKDKGYALIRQGNVEVFVYQLEKLNDIIPEISSWIGIPFSKLENGNLTSEKRMAESYKQAQKEIKITQEYFTKCFEESYVKHFYSEADIEKFKEKWRLHIQ